MDKIPLARPWITDEDRAAVENVLKTDELSLGPKMEEFENSFKTYVGKKHAIAVNSGTSGLHLCIRALGIKDGDEVITTPFSFISSANCIVFEGAKPVFVDIDEKTLNIDPDKIEEAITPKTKAILLVHVFGQPCDMDSIMEIAEKHNLPVIEDACEAIGAEYKGKKVGNFGKLSVFAFYPNKQITTGEGGMVVTDDEQLAKKIKCLRNQGRSTSTKWLDHEEIGYNYRLSEMSCALGASQLKRVDEILEKRSKIALQYNEFLKDIDGVEIPCVDKNVKMSWFVYVVKVDAELRDTIMKELIKLGIAAKPYFQPIHLQAAYKRIFKYEEGAFPVCETTSKKVISIPFYTLLKREEVERVCTTLKEIIRSIKK